MASWDDRLPKETDFARLKWVKSSYSTDTNEPDCVEIAVAPAMVFVRDSKAPGPVLRFTRAAWKALLERPLGG